MKVLDKWWVEKCEDRREVKEVVKNWKKELKKTYPNTKFNLKVDCYSLNEKLTP